MAPIALHFLLPHHEPKGHLQMFVLHEPRDWPAADQRLQGQFVKCLLRVAFC